MILKSLYLSEGKNGNSRPKPRKDLQLKKNMQVYMGIQNSDFYRVLKTSLQITLYLTATVSQQGRYWHYWHFMASEAERLVSMFHVSWQVYGKRAIWMPILKWKTKVQFTAPVTYNYSIKMCCTFLLKMC